MACEFLRFTAWPKMFEHCSTHRELTGYGASQQQRLAGSSWSAAPLTTHLLPCCEAYCRFCSLLQSLLQLLCQKCGDDDSRGRVEDASDDPSCCVPECYRYYQYTNSFLCFDVFSKGIARLCLRRQEEVEGL